MEYEVLFSKMNIGSLELKNRIVMAPMMMGFGAFDGTPTQALLDYYEERAKGGAGLIISEITRVDDVTGAGAFSQLAVSHDYHIEPLKELVKRVHKYGAKLFIQLHHPGRQNLGLLVGTVPLSIFMNKHFPFYEQMLYKIVPFGKKLMDKQLVPRVVAPSKVEPAYFSNSKTKEMSKNSIEKIIKAFVDGAVRVQKAGADGVELHAAHGYLIQQFLSPHTNRRTDEYGGSLDNRMRFILEIIKGIKEKCSESFPIAVRLSVDECYDRIGFKGRGITLKEGVAIAKRLEEAGIDAIDVSSGGYDTFNFWLEPTSFSPGWRKYMAAEVKKEVSIPVIAANLIRSPEQAEQQLIEGVQDLVALGRPLLADAHWSDKVKQGNSKSIKRCINCLYCFESMQVNAYKGGHGLCSVNPRLGREKEELIKDGNGRTVVIIGAGAAGLTAAEMLCLRGFKVIIFEKEAVAGGQLNLTKALPHKEKLSWCIEDLQNTVESLSAEIRFNTEATTDAIKELTPYAVIVATGGKSTVPKSLKGINSSKIYTSTDVLNGTVKFEGKSVAVIGSGMTGLETALYIAEKGNNVKVIELLPEIGKGVWFQHIDDIIPRLNALGVTFLSDCSLNEVREDNVFVSLGRDENLEIPVDYTVFAMGVTPENSLVYELKKDFENVYVIGDAAKPGRIASATMSAFLVASSL